MCWAVCDAINILKIWIKLGRDYNHPYPFFLYLNQCMVDLTCEFERFGITINLLKCYTGCVKKMRMGALIIPQDHILLKTDIHSFLEYRNISVQHMKAKIQISKVSIPKPIMVLLESDNQTIYLIPVLRHKIFEFYRYRYIGIHLCGKWRFTVELGRQILACYKFSFLSGAPL